MDDISPAVANRLQQRSHEPPQCATLVSACGRVSSTRKPTGLACLAPPKVHTTSRCLHIHRVVAWADRVLDLSPGGRATSGSVLSTWRACLAELPLGRALIRRFRDDAVPWLACQKLLKTHGLTHDPLKQWEPLLDTMASARVRGEFARSLQHPLETAKRLGLAEVGWPLSSDAMASLCGLAKHHGVGPIKDANRIALRLPALCGLPPREAAQQVLEVSVAQQQAITDGFTSLPKQRREVLASPPHLDQLGRAHAQRDVELIPRPKNRSN